MKMPSFDRYPRFLAGIGLFLAGGIVGSAVFLSLYHHTYNVLVIENWNLKKENNGLQLDIETLNKFKNKQGLITRVTVHLYNDIQHPLESHVQKALEDRVKRDLKIVEGQKLGEIRDSPQLYERLIASKTYYGVIDKDYIVNVKAMTLVQSELTVWITADEPKKQALPDKGTIVPDHDAFNGSY
ncbi:hypothetical protein ABH899_001094 [Paenibacillus sp. RC84]